MRTILIILLAFIALSCGDAKKDTKSKQNPIQAMVTNPVLSSANSFETSGTVVAENNATIKTRLGGFVDKIYVGIGDQVTKGQLLISINSNDLQAKLSQVNSSIATAQVAYDIAKKDKERYEKLLQQQSISQKEFENVSLQFQAAASQLTAAKEMATEVRTSLSYLQIRAPFSGVITSKKVQEGDLASPGIPLLGIEGTSNFEVQTQIPSNKIQTVNAGDPVEIFIKDLNRTQQGILSELSPSSVNNGSVFEAKVAFNEQPEDLNAGLFANLTFRSESEASAKILIPTKALVQKGSLTGVYVHVEGTAFLRWIRTGQTNGDLVEVLSGISENDTLIIPSAEIKNGTHVTIN